MLVIKIECNFFYSAVEYLRLKYVWCFVEYQLNLSNIFKREKEYKPPWNNIYLIDLIIKT